MIRMRNLDSDVVSEFGRIDAVQGGIDAHAAELVNFQGEITELNNGGPVQVATADNYSGAPLGRRVILLNAAAGSITWNNFRPPWAGYNIVVACVNSAHPVTLKCGTGVTFDGTNNTATFGANKALWLCAASESRWIIMANVGTVALSST